MQSLARSSLLERIEEKMLERFRTQGTVLSGFFFLLQHLWPSASTVIPSLVPAELKVLHGCYWRKRE
jgi:hypothetical protein